jgi:LPXTG-motif cell wall-anchored protein
MPRGPRSLLDDLFGLCFGLLLAAIAVHVAVKLIEAVWPALLVIMGVGLLLAAGVVLLRRRDRGW